MPKTGKRTKKRQETNRRLIDHLKKLGICQCEIRIPGVCVRSIMITIAHAKKSRFLITDDDWLTAALACIPCHLAIEQMSHADMEKHVVEAIQRRTCDDDTQ